ncbi:hypothetical protein NDN08_001301 [Rhodosorus marinus]|uniref:HIG1 domain-containing protein n=1 Tax=Rhodosorus marinus TaxID=101924 RepID=A0AAV8UTF3_9RHOD|nr:hypothetical protein NDN08_001301 [Rhodosorus marinus]
MSSALAVLRGRASEALHRRLNGRELPLMYPFLGLMMAGGFTTYIRGQWAANERQRQMEIEMAEKRQRMGFTEDEKDPAYSGEYAFVDKPSADSFNKKVGLASLAGAAVGVQLYRQWDRKSVAMALLHTRVLAQGTIVLGVIAYFGLRDYRRKVQEKLEAAAE